MTGGERSNREAAHIRKTRRGEPAGWDAPVQSRALMMTLLGIVRMFSAVIGVPIKVTFDTYGHLFADVEADQRAAEGIELRLLGS